MEQDQKLLSLYDRVSEVLNRNTTNEYLVEKIKKLEQRLEVLTEKVIKHEVGKIYAGMQPAITDRENCAKLFSLSGTTENLELVVDNGKLLFCFLCDGTLDKIVVIDKH